MNRRNLIRAIGSAAAVTTTAVTAGCLDDASDIASSVGQSNVPDYTVGRTEYNEEYTNLEDEELYIEEGDEDEEDELVFEVVLETVDEHEDLGDNCIGFEFGYEAVDEDGVIIEEQEYSSTFVARNSLSLDGTHRETLVFPFDEDEIDEVAEIEIMLFTPEQTLCV